MRLGGLVKENRHNCPPFTSLLTLNLTRIQKKVTHLGLHLHLKEVRDYESQQ